MYFLAVLLYFCPANATPPDNVSGQEILDSKTPNYINALSAMDKGDYPHAVKLFELALKRGENPAMCHYRLANIYRFVMADEAKSNYHLNKYIELLRNNYAENQTDAEIKEISDVSSQNHVKAIEIFQQAMSDASTGKLDSAKEKMEQAVLLFPFDPVIYYNLAVVNHKLNLFADAVFCYQKALALDTNHQPAMLGLAMAFEQKGDDISAIESYKKVLQANPKNIYALNNLAILLEKIDMIDDAITHYEHIILIDPKYVRALNNLGTIYARKNDFNQAKSYLEKAINADPAYLAPRFNLGLIYEQQGNYCGALKEYRMIFLKDSAYPEIADKIAAMEKKVLPEHQISRSNTIIKDPIIKNTAQDTQPAKNQLEIHTTALNKTDTRTPAPDKNTAGGVTTSSDTIKSGSKPANDYFELALQLKSENDYDGAIKCIEEGLKKNPANIKMRYLNAKLLKEKQYYFKAIKEYETIIKTAPGEKKALYELSLIYSDKENPLRDSKKALSYYKDYINLTQNTDLKPKTGLAADSEKQNMAQKKASFETKPVNKQFFSDTHEDE